MIARCHSIRYDVGVHAGYSPNHRASADSTVLLNSRQPAKDRAFSNPSVTAQHSAVRECYVAFDNAVMTDMAHSHKVSVVPDGCDTAPGPAATAHRDTFANDTVTANDQPALQKVIVANLPNPAQHGLGMYDCPGADLRVAGHDDVRLQPHAVTQNDICSDQTIWPDLDAAAQLRSVFDNRRGMHR